MLTDIKRGTTHKKYTLLYIRVGAKGKRKKGGAIALPFCNYAVCGRLLIAIQNKFANLAFDTNMT